MIFKEIFQLLTVSFYYDWKFITHHALNLLPRLIRITPFVTVRCSRLFRTV